MRPLRQAGRRFFPIGIALAASILLWRTGRADTVVLQTPLDRGALILDHDNRSGLGSSVAGRVECRWAP
jgi:hypothetical protein